MESAAESVWNGFSLAERDRRWTAVRGNAAGAGFDCIFLPLCCDGTNFRMSLEGARGARSDSRYLTQTENSVLVLPTDGRTPIAVNMSGVATAWLKDVRGVGRRSWVDAMARALADAGMDRAHIGVPGLKRGKMTHARAFDGVVNHGAYEDVVRRFPNATFEDATDVVGFARYIKSDEEIACLQRGAQIASAGIAEMAAVARPGVMAATVYARVMERMLELGSEYYSLAFYPGPIGATAPRCENPPIGVRLERDWLITDETVAVWGGLIAQEVQPIVLGAVPETWKPVIELQRDMFQAGLEHMRPGTEFADMIDFVNGFGPKRGMRSIILMHGRGYGNDGPLLTPQDRGEFFRDVRIEKDNVWVFKPIALSADGSVQFSWGGVVRVTERGGESLVSRPHGLISAA